jgi:hypothetical protein
MAVVDHRSPDDHAHAAERVLLTGCVTLLSLVVIFGSLLLVRHEQQYVRLAESFLSGRLHLLVELPEHLHDTAFYAGRYYWPLGPFPAVLLMPFVLACRWTGIEFYQAYASVPLSLWTSWLIFRLASRCGRSKVEGAWLALAFCGASSYPSVAAISMSWPFAQVVAIHLLFLALHEWLGRRWWLLIGLLLGLTAARAKLNLSCRRWAESTTSILTAAPANSMSISPPEHRSSWTRKTVRVRLRS